MYLPLLDAAAPAQSSTGSTIYLIVSVAVMALLFYFMIIRPQKKKQKEEQKLRDSLQVGDEILTIGGFYGKIISIKEDSLVIESVLDHTKQKIARWAIQHNLTVHDTADAAKK